MSICNSDDTLTHIIQQMKDKGLNIEDQGHPADYIGVNIKKVSLQLHAFKDSPKIDGKFNYCSVIGKLNYLRQTMRPHIVYARHQVAKYSSDPRKEHGEAIIYIIKYLKATRHIGLHFKPDIVLQTSQKIGTSNIHLQTLVLPSLEVDGSYSMLVALSFGHGS